MPRLALSFAISAAVLLAACASAPGDKPDAAPKPSAPPITERIAPPVKVPETARRKVVLSMTGPKNVVEASDWTDFRNEWRYTFGEYAKTAGIAFSFVDGAAQPTGEDGTLLLVTVDDYRIVNISTRIFLGAMIGNAFIDARVRFASLRDGAPFGEQAYHTSSSAWDGVAAKVTPQQVDAIGYNVFLDLKPAK